MVVVKVFVYGTLKPGESNYDRYCAGKVIEAQRAIAFGQLFALPMGYPAMTLGDGIANGVLLIFTNPTILRNLDELEGYEPSRPATQNEYYRQEIEIYSLKKQSLGKAWAYLMTSEQVRRQRGVLLPDGWWSRCQS